MKNCEGMQKRNERNWKLFDIHRGRVPQP